MTRSIACAATALSMAQFGIAASVVAQDVDMDTVALTGDDAPGTDRQFSSFLDPVLNNSGDVAFRARLSQGRGGPSADGIWLYTEAGLELIALQDDLAPGAGGWFYRDFDDVVLNDMGEVAFRARLHDGNRGGSGGSSVGVFGPRPSGLLGRIAIREGNAPGTGGARFQNFSQVVVLNNAGEVAFQASLQHDEGGRGTPQIDSDNDSGIWATTGSNLSLELIAREGDVAPSTADGTYVNDFRNPVINNRGEIAFWARFQEVPGRGNRSQAIFGPGDAGLQPLAVEGQAAPGADKGELYSVLGDPVINDAGEVAFKADIFTTSRGIQDQGLFGPTPSGLSLFVRKGDAAPGTGQEFLILDDVVLNSAGEIAFLAQITGPSDLALGVWGPTASGLGLIARRGFAAPGLTNRAFDGLFQTTINALGEVAFDFETSEQARGNTEPGIFGPTCFEFSAIVHAGQQLDQMPEGATEVDGNRLHLSNGKASGGQDGRGRTLNDWSQTTFFVRFDDATQGLYITHACHDCNNNDIPDEDDIASGASADCNNDGVPDECQPGALIGRPDPEGSTDRVMRGYIVMWAVNRENQQIRWNHLAGDATIINYREGAAWEYTAYGIQSTEDGVDNGDPLGTHGVLRFDGDEYAAIYDHLLFNFQASNSIGLTRHGSLGAGGLVVADTDLTLLPITADFRQESDGPTSTRAVMNIWNQNEVKFSGTHRCIECWDQTLLSSYDAPNAFLFGVLGTITGKARIDGLASTDCDASTINPTIDAAMLGVKVTHASVRNQPNSLMLAGSNLHGMGVEEAVIRYDVLDGSPPENAGDDSSVPYTTGSMLGVDQETIDTLVGHLASGRIKTPQQIDALVRDRLDHRRSRRAEAAGAQRSPSRSDIRGRGQGQGEPTLGGPRLSNSEKGSVLIFPKVELRWDADGRLVQDTFIQLANDRHEDVRIQAIFVQGDPPAVFPCSESGWNWVDAEFELTANQPTYWSVRTGQPSTGGLPPFTVLDN